MVSASFGHFKSPLGWRFDLIIRARRLECGVYDALTLKLTSIASSLFKYIGSLLNKKTTKPKNLNLMVLIINCLFSR
ncbi:hypothetical protein D8T47_13710 [Vibrio vulnificus]|nr:hypothetical protein D8T47_13710 [Vibrio vulnificus]